LFTYTDEVAAVFTEQIIGFCTITVFIYGKLSNLLTQSDFKLAGPVLTQFTLKLIVSRPIVRTFSTKQYSGRKYVHWRIFVTETDVRFTVW